MAPTKRSRSRIPSPKPTLDEIKETVEKCKLLPKRTFEDDQEVEFYQQLRSAGLHRMVKEKNVGNETFVRHFYSYTKFYDTLNVRFRNVQITSFTPAAIRSFYRIPLRSECRFQQLKDAIDEFPQDEIAQTLGGSWYQIGDHGQYYIGRSHMCATARNWLIFVCSYIQPTSHMTHIPPKLALLIYLLMTNQPVQVETLIYESLYESVFNSRVNRSLILPHMISDMFTAAGVPEERTDIKFQPKEKTNYARINDPVPTHQATDETNLASSSQAQPQRPPRSRATSSAPPPSSSPQIMELLSTILQNQERMFQSQEFIKEQLRLVHERLDNFHPSPLDRGGSHSAQHYSRINVAASGGTEPFNDATSGGTAPLNLDEDEGES